MKYTENYNLKKPDKEDFYNIEDFNENADIIDAELNNLKNTIENLNADGITLPDGKTISEKFEEIETEIGNIEELDTDTKSNIIAAINEIYQELETHKAESAIHKTSDVIRTETNTQLKVEVVSSSVSETPDAGRIIFDTSQGKFFGGNGTEWV